MRYLSLFSGIEAASVAWHGLGWTPVAFAEVDAYACAALAERFPHVPNLGDVTKITDEQITALGPVDVVIGGSPCQDLSVAGKRAGLGGERSSLFHEQVRIFHAARSFCGARWNVWENVPGAFSSNRGRDFAVVVGTLAGCDFRAPVEGWGSEGVALGTNGFVEWCVLDAQWFGLAQRRERVFAVLDSGNWRDRPPVLLEPESLRGHSPPSRSAGQGIAASTLRRTDGGSDVDHAKAGHLTPEVSHPLTGINAGRAQEDGTGRGCPLVPDVAWCLQERDAKGPDSDSGGMPAVALAFKAGQSEAAGGTFVTKEYAPTLQAVNNGSTAVPAIAFADVADPVAANQGRTYTREGSNNFRMSNVAHTAMQVRRLTPRECERLQGFPDDWTLIDYRRKPAKDGPRYKALGNSMAVPVITWIGKQLERAHDYDERAA